MDTSTEQQDNTVSIRDPHEEIRRVAVRVTKLLPTTLTDNLITTLQGEVYIFHDSDQTTFVSPDGDAYVAIHHQAWQFHGVSTNGTIAALALLLKVYFKLWAASKSTHYE